MQADLQRLQLELLESQREERETETRMRAAEERQSALFDAIATARLKLAPAPVTDADKKPAIPSGTYSVIKQVQNVLDVARIQRTTISPGVLVASMAVNSARFEGKRVIFVAADTLQQLLADKAIEPATL